MDTFSDLIAGVQTELNLTPTSTYPSQDKVKYALNAAYYVFGSLHKWSKLDDAKKTSSIDCQVDGEQYYGYPQNWYPDSMWKVGKDGVDYGDPLFFKDFLYEVKNKYPNCEKQIWANQWDRFFLSGVSSVGNSNISIWGSKVVDTLVAPGDNTIFSFNLREANIAMIDEACSRLKLSGQDIGETSVRGVGELQSAKAKEIMGIILKRFRMERMRKESTQPMFQVGDMFRRGGSTARGRRNHW